ncbi:hypothetical protein P175DRAFT_0500493 [Aspergillus ochraceoroseus IBT 24754]|uniref:Conidiation protein Con-6 n=1 Tax=Aspergillus ochraceoroseus IBT 24754 TaxID=1392256 RepID=A0A2T5LZ95_9EURO|nr:uncharacterized protein P175DRAFT_0500493 [Aspergillus ochraceoroseus IBT 24754]PTU21611.1 hypothetical protein P175DRAFT_0500493 [Aspergillus ochraceoroseus IBT 24754]
MYRARAPWDCPEVSGNESLESQFSCDMSSYSYPGTLVPDTYQVRINSARGYKAALHNPRVSEDAKQHASKMLQEIHDEEARRKPYKSAEPVKDPARIAAGLKGAQHNPRVSGEGKHRATEKLHEMGRDNPEC